MSRDLAPPPDSWDRAMVRLYVLVIVVETVVIAGLWGFGRYFG